MKTALLIAVMLFVFVPVSFGGDSTSMFLTLGDVAASSSSGTGTCDGQMLWIKVTPTSYTGSLGGITGANAICNAAYPGYHFCARETDIEPARLRGCLPDPLPYNSPQFYWTHTNVSLELNCSNWSSLMGVKAGNILIPVNSSVPPLYWSFDGGSYVCNTMFPLACCK